MIAQIAAVLVAVGLGWFYKAIRPPPPLICGRPGGAPVTSPRIKLGDGRHLAYRETGVPKEKAKYKIVAVHGFADSKDTIFPASQELIEELGICLVSFDRAGYGESDPNPKRSVKSDAMDIQQLADQLELGPRFYVIGCSMGGYPTWGCLNYIPHRLAGVALVVPIINFWWPSFPANLSRSVFRKLDIGDQRVFWIAHHLPFLFYGWTKQRWFKPSPSLTGHPDKFTTQDLEVMQKRIAYRESIGFHDKATQQGVHESLYRDVLVGYGKWEFDPMEIKNPFPDNEGSVHIWQGYQDKLIPLDLQHYVAKKLPWIKYHENPEGGHFFAYVDDWGDKIIKALLLGDEPKEP